VPPGQHRPGQRPRPAGARRTTGTTTGRRPTSPNRLTGRATVLVLVLSALLLAYAYPVRIYLNQQAEIAALRAHQRQQQAHIADLRAESAKWNDPAYVEAQARSRLQMGRPGETLYIVVDGDTPDQHRPERREGQEHRPLVRPAVVQPDRRRPAKQTK